MRVLRNEQVIAEQQTEQPFTPMWEIKMHYRAEKNYVIKAERQRQFYARHMEMYKTSLHASQNLHHRITRDNGNSTKIKPEKLGKKALEAKLINSQRLLEIEEKKNLQIFADFERNAHSITELDLKLKTVKSPSAKLLFNLMKLRIKLIREQGLLSISEQSKVDLFLYIKDLFEKFHSFLIDGDDSKHFITILIDLKLFNVAKHFRDFLLSKTNKKQALTKTLSSLNIDQRVQNTFNEDIYFQLNHVGEYLERSLNSQVDSRVCFKPDMWQRDLLDIVDKNESALICAPTSSGKTFISYYAMEKILRSNSSDVVVFISPNKSLANQVAAEVYTRFGHLDNVYAMSMPDYVVNDPFGCQILITVPTTFESILSNNSEWVQKVKYIIIDEIQTMNDKELGASLEKIIHFAECPILALSATIGNLQPFYEWMRSVQLSKRIEVHRIVHTERFCDLKKYLFVPTMSKSIESTLLPLNELYGYSSTHLKSTKAFSEDFHLLPKEIFKLLTIITKVASTIEQRNLVESLLPERFFDCVLLNKSDVKRYETFLVERLRNWAQTGMFSNSQIDRIFNELNGECDEAFANIDTVYGQDFSGKEWMTENIGK